MQEMLSVDRTTKSAVTKLSLAIKDLVGKSCS